ncbi:CrcB family protein [Actinomycetaceae bacterium L2_0104]
MGSLNMDSGAQTTPRAEDTTARSRSRWTIPRFALLVAVGATLGTLLRATISSAFPHPVDGWPWATFAINVAGSFILGLLLEALVLSGDDTGWRRTLRLTCGTGVLGGFTTYSTYVLEVEKLFQEGVPAYGLLYALASLAFGLIAAGAGIALATAVSGRRRAPGTSTNPKKGSGR